MRRFVVPFIALLALAGCITLPAPEIQNFDDAFQETRRAGAVLLDKVSPIIADVLAGTPAQPECARVQMRVMACFDPRLAVTDYPAEPLPIAVRRLALDLVEAYSRLLTGYASGQPVAQAQGRVDAVIALGSTLLSFTGAGAGLGPIVENVRQPLQALIARLAQARSRIEARELIISQRDVIKGLLRELEADTPVLYQIYRSAGLARWADLRLTNPSAAEQVLADINAYHRSLALYVRLLRKTADAFDVLAAAAEQPIALNANSLRLVMEEAIAMRNEATAFWDAIRQVRTLAP
jgi:hypothetical protein